MEEWSQIIKLGLDLYLLYRISEHCTLLYSVMYCYVLQNDLPLHTITPYCKTDQTQAL